MSACESASLQVSDSKDSDMRLGNQRSRLSLKVKALSNAKASTIIFGVLTTGFEVQGCSGLKAYGV